jgi:Glycosyl transferase family group 2
MRPAKWENHPISPSSNTSLVRPVIPHAVALFILPFLPDVMQVAHHYFENGITHFTRRINKCISFGCANGEVAPFVGHNAFLRWSAVQDAAFVDSLDGVKKQWSETNVSEDFDLALRLLLNGYSLRWATYSNRGFKEGVSLTVIDELARWQKYAYGMRNWFGTWEDLEADVSSSFSRLQ